MASSFKKLKLTVYIFRLSRGLEALILNPQYYWTQKTRLGKKSTSNAKDYVVSLTIFLIKMASSFNKLKLTVYVSRLSRNWPFLSKNIVREPTYILESQVDFFLGFVKHFQ